MSQETFKSNMLNVSRNSLTHCRISGYSQKSLRNGLVLIKTVSVKPTIRLRTKRHKDSFDSEDQKPDLNIMLTCVALSQG